MLKLTVENWDGQTKEYEFESVEDFVKSRDEEYCLPMDEDTIIDMKITGQEKRKSVLQVWWKAQKSKYTSVEDFVEYCEEECEEEMEEKLYKVTMHVSLEIGMKDYNYDDISDWLNGHSIGDVAHIAEIKGYTVMPEYHEDIEEDANCDGLFILEREDRDLWKE